MVELLDALDASPAAKNTIIVLWSDHGWHLGEKQHLHKFTLWERSTRVPYIIVAPNVTPANARCSRPVGLIDTFPTLIELCSLPTVEGLDGVSLVPLLKNPSLEWSRPALTTHGQGNHSLRTERWRYIRYANGDEELYDHYDRPPRMAQPRRQARVCGREDGTRQVASADRCGCARSKKKPKETE